MKTSIVICITVVILIVLVAPIIPIRADVCLLPNGTETTMTACMEGNPVLTSVEGGPATRHENTIYVGLIKLFLLKISPSGD